MQHQTKDIILNHYQANPASELQDLIKLLFQNEFGGGHLIADPKESLNRIAAETNQAKPADISVENIGNGYHRLHLGKHPSISLKTINAMFVSSAMLEQGTIDGLVAKLMILLELIRERILPFSYRRSKMEIAEYIQLGCPMISHSSIYRRSYAPAYRVMRKEFTDFILLYAMIEKALQTKTTIIVSIEGGSASGKSTLATNLNLLFDASVIHMDDFFLQLHQRTSDRFAEIGGNVDYERFNLEVGRNLERGTPFSYQKFDCSSMKLTEEIVVTKSKVVVVEGVYSNHPKLHLKPDISVFLDIDPTTQTERLTKRNHPDIARRFFEEWIPMENRYFETFSVKSASDLAFIVG